MPVLARFRIVKPRLDRARVEVKPYASYSFGSALSEALFNTRVEALQAHVRQKFPFVHPALDRLALLLSILACIYMIIFLVIKLMTMNNSNGTSSKFDFDIPSWTMVLLLPIGAYLGFYLWLKWRMKTGLKEFEASLTVLLKQFTNADLTTQNIKWIYRRRIKRRTGQVRMSIYILQGDSEQEIDTLPLYRQEYEDLPIEEGGPPCYDDVMALARVETGDDGWMESADVSGNGNGTDSFEYSRRSLSSQVGLVLTQEPSIQPEAVVVEMRGLPPGYRESV